MKRIVNVAFALLVPMGLASAQIIRTMNVSYPSGSDTVSGYMAMPNPSSTVVVQKKYFLWQFDLDKRMRLEKSM